MATLSKKRVLGEGASAVVYQADLITHNNKHVAIAIKSSRPCAAYTLIREGSILRSFRGCKEIVQCMGSYMTEENGDSICNLLMEYAPYGSVGDLIKLKPLFEEEVRVFTRMILKGLSHIHHNGIVHCDLKPDNVLLFPSSQKGARYQLKIADFGISKTKEGSLEVESWNNKFKGTPFYMSPESMKVEIDTALDIWSLGCIVLEMITGLKAWGKVTTVQNVMFKLGVLKETPKIPDELSKDCKDFLSKCFLKDSTERWSACMLLNHPFSRISDE